MVFRNGRCVQWVNVGGRHVKLKCLGGVQSVNICTVANRAGVYENREFLTAKIRLTAQDVARFPNIGALKAELWRRTARQAR